MVLRLRAVAVGTVECTMIDYADFNYQHTIEAQVIVFETLAEILQIMGHHQDKARAARWIADAPRVSK